MTNLTREIEFISELEKLKTVYRYNKVIDQSRPENSAEHSWHIALMALVFADQAGSLDLDLLKVLKMLLIHDLVEIDCGDTFLYDQEGRSQAVITEREAAVRIFGLLPDNLGNELFSLWQEFEERETPEAKYAASMDALQPLINHLLSCKQDFNPDNMSKSAVISKKEFIGEVSASLWEIAQDTIDKSVEKGLYHPY